MKIRLTIALILAILAVAVSFDLGSQRSRLLGWVELGRADVSAAKKVPASSSQTMLDMHPLRVEARAIWAAARGLSLEKNQERFRAYLKSYKPEQQYQLLRAMGIELSRQRFDRLVAQAVASESRMTHMMLFQKLLKAWCEESPRAALAWVHFMGELYETPGNLYTSDIHLYLLSASKGSLNDPDAWAAFLKESPDPTLAKVSELWLAEFKEPGSIWAHLKNWENEDGVIISIIALNDYLTMVVDEGSVETVMKVLENCDDALKEEIATCVAIKLNPEALRTLARSTYRADRQVQNLFFAIAGDEGVSYEMAADYLNLAYREGINESAELLYVQWFKRGGVEDAFKRMVSQDTLVSIDAFMNQAVKLSVLDEASLVRLSEGLDQRSRDSTFLSYYQALFPNNPRATLDLIIKSDLIDDQVRAAESILVTWARSAPAEAAQWFKELPTGNEYPEIAAEIADMWMRKDLEAGVKFTQEQGLGLSKKMRVKLMFAINSMDLMDASVVRVLQQLRHEPGYDELITMTAWAQLHSSTDFSSTLQFVEKHNPGRWQQPLVAQLSRSLESGQPRYFEMVESLLSQGQASLTPEQVKVLRENLLKAQQAKVAPKK